MASKISSHRMGLVCAALTGAVLFGWGCATSGEQRFQHHVDYLASDKLEGRGIGSHGIELAADYIADHFRRYGLRPAGDDGSYFQSFTMPTDRAIQTETRLAFSPSIDGLNLREDYLPFSFSSDEEFSGPVVFCGYGIVDPDRGVDDFVHLDLSGKVALMLRGEPASWADENGNPTRHAMFRNKVYNAKDRGATAVLLVSAAPAEGETDDLVPFEKELADSYGIPAFHIKRSVADAVLKEGGLPSLDELQAQLDGGTFASATLRGVRADGQAVFKTVEVPTHNVVGMLPGTGPHADEIVVVGAHYDHLGIRRPMKRVFREGKLVTASLAPQIHNGADDNASGVAGLLEIARMFQRSGAPDRSVLFIAFTAEETGLQGSTHFINHLGFPPDRIVAMLNMDMIGRMPEGTSKVTVFGTKTGKCFMEILEPEAEKLALEIGATPDAGGNSDHAVFVRKEIPSLHFFTGHHAQYHAPEDDADLINAAGGEKVARLVYAVARDLADRPDRPEYELVKAKGESQVAGTPSFRVVMGLTPGYVDDGNPGMKVEAVNPEGPADLAGMKAGDRIIRIGEKPVANIYDYMAATRDNKPGDAVSVVVLRSGEETALSVTLAAAR
ncbi:MAG: M20/M25/M40 family metallo-hydrolase [Phycisphaerae bacterium]|nr:M20/M25/M40 family metallo-hydrolase [Phycisphaerae bacterium]